MPIQGIAQRADMHGAKRKNVEPIQILFYHVVATGHCPSRSSRTSPSHLLATGRVPIICRTATDSPDASQDATDKSTDTKRGGELELEKPICRPTGGGCRAPARAQVEECKGRVSPAYLPKRRTSGGEDVSESEEESNKESDEDEDYVESMPGEESEETDETDDASTVVGRGGWRNATVGSLTFASHWPTLLDQGKQGSEQEDE